MSDVEEPPTKMSKYEEYLEEECLEEDVQEEWLSEGGLTDDDYHISMPDPDKTDSNLDTSQEGQDTMISQESEPRDQSTVAEDSQMGDAEGTEEEEATETEESQSGDVKAEQNIEDALNNLDGKIGLPEDTLDTFLIRKIDGKVVEGKKNELPPLNEKEEDDGNDTDDLLRLLEDDQQQKKKTIKILNVKSEKMEDLGSSDDDEYIYERSKVKTLRLAKNAVIKRVPSKAVPEESDSDDESEESSDEIGTMKRMFGVRTASPKPTPPRRSIQSKTNQNGKLEPKKIVKHVVQVNTNYTKPPQLQKIASKQAKLESKPVKQVVKTTTTFKDMEKEKKIAQNRKMEEEEMDEIIDEEEFLEGDDIELDEEEFGEGSEGSRSERQHIMKPEMMDEEVPSDEDSHSEDEEGSLYDELPSSDSEDMDDWFTLDIRAETASDYLPLLGSCARSLLTAERKRAQTRVDSLRKSLSALTDSAKRQAESLKQATMTLAEIDDTLRAA